MRVFTDANVFYSRTLRDWLALLQLQGGTYTVYWTEDVLAETVYRLRRRHPDWNGAKITAIRDRIAGTFEGGRVDDFTIDGSFPGGDVDDQHVHAAALACQADFILTCDNGFIVAGQDVDSMPYEVYRPDDFFVLVDDSAPHVVRQVTYDQTLYWVGRTGRADLASKLSDAGCPEFAERVRDHQGRLSFPVNADHS
ncbi:PIN domain-containing protein [Actinokineospora sp. PR83]|uniref:PIN domain-containing protein n=1 Tax=Actinokineospora sp. PR83 TaxID=2884908 RepID=UPI001F302821|nr:PIN domain-containing protein [Actinokineospora sp. PR83]MCG8916727.1 PIN domain-containing protein [Actinokineospora sp. PR83]